MNRKSFMAKALLACAGLFGIKAISKADESKQRSGYALVSNNRAYEVYNKRDTAQWRADSINERDPDRKFSVRACAVILDFEGA